MIAPATIGRGTPSPSPTPIKAIPIVAAVVGGRGGGRPHMAQAGVEEPGRIDEALGSGGDVVRRILAGDA